MTSRRAFLGAAAAIFASRSSAAVLQAAKPVTIGWLSIAGPSRERGPEEWRPDFEREMVRLGWNARFELHYAAGDADRLRVAGEELVKTKVAVIVAPDTQGALAAKRATTSIPIVAMSGDPVGAGLVTSLARPGGNVTGVSSAFDEGIGGKWVELLRELGARDAIAVVLNPAAPTGSSRIAAIEKAATAFGLRVHRLAIREAADVDAVAQALGRTRFAGVIFDGDNTLIPYARAVAEATRRHRLPSVFPFGFQAERLGALFGYGTSLPVLFRRLATYVDRILRGAKPADLPVEQAHNYELVINLKTARDRDVTIPPSLLLRADQLIE